MTHTHNEKEMVLRLYIAGMTPNCTKAVENLQALCRTSLEGRYTLEIINLLENPVLAKEHQIVAIPTLVRELPKPIRKIVGNLSNHERVLMGLDIRPVLKAGAGEGKV